MWLPGGPAGASSPGSHSKSRTALPSELEPLAQP